MLENSVYSVLSPEGFASILYKDASKNKEAAEKMKITAKDLKELGIIDDIIKEKDNQEENLEFVSAELKEYITKFTIFKEVFTELIISCVRLFFVTIYEVFSPSTLL